MSTAPGHPTATRRGAPPSVGERYRHNTARHLIGISRDLQARTLGRLADAHGYRGLRPSLGPLLSLLWDEGRSITALSEPLAISKQACSQLANLAEAAGYLARKPDPADGRSKHVVLTRRGRALVTDAVRSVLEVEGEYAALVGAAPVRRFAASLGALYGGLGIATHADAALAARARGSVGVLPLIATRIQSELMAMTSARGHRGLKMSFGLVLPFLGPDGGRIHEIARVQRVSRQAISVTSKELEALGYLRRDADPRDGRGRVLRLTARGTRLIADSVGAADALDARFGDILGAQRHRALQRVGRDLYRALHLEEEVFGARLGADAPRADAAARERANDPRDIRRLATTLRRRLGSSDASRLAALLETPKTEAL